MNESWVEPVWWAIAASKGPMVARWNDTRESFIEMNELTTNFRILYGPVTRREAEEFLEDIFPPQKRRES